MPLDTKKVVSTAGDSLSYSPEISGQDIESNSIFVIGGGHFGKRAVSILCELGHESIFLVDRCEEALKEFEGMPVKRFQEDGVRFLERNFRQMSNENIIVPALPVHLAFEWLRCRSAEGFTVERMLFPETIASLMPKSWHGKEDDLLVSYADFLCPDDCPEPDRCTVTGEKREKPLFQYLSDIETRDFDIFIIRSRQIAPGLGGYRVGDLLKAERAVRDGDGTTWLIGTACKCHGVISAFKVS